MDVSYHRHDLSDHAWSLLGPHLPGQNGQWGGVAEDNRRFFNGVFWILRTGARVPPGETYHPKPEAGTIPIAGLFVGETKVFGRIYWIF